MEQRGRDTLLVLKSVHALEGVLMSVADPGSETNPSAMRASDAKNMQWVIPLEELPTPQQRLYLVASSGGVQYFGDAATLFIKRQE